jgi:hypothetical protein
VAVFLLFFGFFFFNFSFALAEFVIGRVVKFVEAFEEWVFLWIGVEREESRNLSRDLSNSKKDQ